MKVLDSISIQQPHQTAMVQLFQGDLSAIPPEEKVDILVISAFPDNYRALPGSLVLALEEKGLSLKELAEDKLEDLRPQVGCWFSKPIPESLQATLNFRQVLCFEPGTNSTDAIEVVGNIFRCINNYAFDETVSRIALPVIATGYQKVPFDKMFPVLIDTAIFWLKQGLPLDCIKIVIHKQEYIEKATELFRIASRMQLGLPDFALQVNQPFPANPPLYDVPPPPPAASRGTSTERVKADNTISKNPVKQNGINAIPVIAGKDLPKINNDDAIDYFISYAHTQGNLIQHFVEELLKIKPGLKLFYDKSSIPPGGLWIRQISDAITKAGKVLIFMSPDYSASMICWDEFQCAKLKEYNNRIPVIQTIYLTNDPALPPIMGINSYIDCREGDLVKLTTACGKLIEPSSS